MVCNLKRANGPNNVAGSTEAHNRSSGASLTYAFVWRNHLFSLGRLSVCRLRETLPCFLITSYCRQVSFLWTLGPFIYNWHYYLTVGKFTLLYQRFSALYELVLQPSHNHVAAASRQKKMDVAAAFCLPFTVVWKYSLHGAVAASNKTNRVPVFVITAKQANKVAPALNHL